MKFCKLGDLGFSTRKLIHDELSYSGGAMQNWLEQKRQDMHICLLYNGKLASWAALGVPRGQTKSISAWTRKEYRNRGYAQTAIWAILDRHRISHSVRLLVFSAVTRRILKRLKFTSFNVGSRW